MSTYHLPDIDTDTQHEWLQELMGAMHWGDEQQAMAATTAVLHSLRDHLSDTTASLLGAHLPLSLRCSYYEGWNAQRRAPGPHSREQLLGELGARLPVALAPHAEWLAQQVLRLLRRHLDRRTLEQIARDLSPTMRTVLGARAAEPRQDLRHGRGGLALGSRAARKE